MNEASIAIRYGTPQIRDHGRLSVLTTFDGGGLHFAQVTVGSLPGGGGEPTPAPVANPGITTPAQGVLDTGASTPVAPDSTAVRGDGNSSPGSAEGTTGVESGSSGGGGGGGVGSGSDNLPFTGMAVGPVAALGAGLAAAGATLRRRTRRR